MLQALPPQPPALSALIAAEHAFARSAREKGTNQAFLAALHPQATMFNPGPVLGRTLYTGPEDGSLLSWGPAFAWVSKAWDLGATTGPWTYHAKPGEPALRQGWFISVWLREASGPWKLYIDLGISHPTTPLAPLLPDPAVAATGSVPPEDATLTQQLLEADRAFAKEATTRGLAPAYAARFDTECRFYRKGVPPAEGPQACAALLATSPGNPTWRPDAGRTAVSGDLGFTRGVWLEGTRETAAYVRIWRKVRGQWRVLIDVTSPYGK